MVETSKPVQSMVQPQYRPGHCISHPGTLVSAYLHKIDILPLTSVNYIPEEVFFSNSHGTYCRISN